jgi:uncharacterized protein YeaO (DUF488 family)
MNIRLRRVYDEATGSDGSRVLVDRMWPRGKSKDDLRIDAWCKDIAPGNELRKWFNHEPEKWEEFKQRYFHELDSKPDLVKGILDLAEGGMLTLVYSSRDEERNNAVALKEYLTMKMKP